MLCQTSDLLFGLEELSTRPQRSKTNMIQTCTQTPDSRAYQELFISKKSWMKIQALNLSEGMGLSKGQILKQCVRRLIHKH